MVKSVIELAISDSQKKINQSKEFQSVKLFSKEFFFDKKYAEHRSRVTTLDGLLARRSLLSLLIREGMTQKHRENIFPDNFDLGNMSSVSPELGNSS